MKIPVQIIVFAASIAAVFSSCEPIKQPLEIKTQYTTTQYCQASEDPRNVQDNNLKYSRIITRQIFPESPYVVFLILNEHKSVFEKAADSNEKLINLQSNIYHLLSEIDKMYCLDLIGHEGINSGVSDI